MSRTRYYYKRFKCVACGEVHGKVMTEDDFQNNPPLPCLKCGKKTKRVTSLGINPISRPGFAKARNVWNRSDASSPNAADRDKYESFKDLEAQGKLTGRLKAESKEEIQEMMVRKGEFT